MVLPSISFPHPLCPKLAGQETSPSLSPILYNGGKCGSVKDHHTQIGLQAQQWDFHLPDPSGPVVTYSWTVSRETEAGLTGQLGDPGLGGSGVPVGAGVFYLVPTLRGGDLTSLCL